MLFRSCDLNANRRQSSRRARMGVLRTRKMRISHSYGCAGGSTHGHKRTVDQSVRDQGQKGTLHAANESDTTALCTEAGSARAPWHRSAPASGPPRQVPAHGTRHTRREQRAAVCPERSQLNDIDACNRGNTRRKRGKESLSSKHTIDLHAVVTLPLEGCVSHVHKYL